MTSPDALDPETPTPGRPARRYRRWIALATVAAVATAAAVVLGMGFGRDPRAVQSALLDRPAPPLAGATLDGDQLDIRSFRGKVVLVNVWASWCAECRDEHPVLTAAQQQFAADGLQIIGLNMSDTRDDAQRFLTEMGGAAYPSMFDPDARIAVAWGTYAVPETYVVDGTGTIVRKATGPITADWITTNVVPLLNR